MLKISKYKLVLGVGIIFVGVVAVLVFMHHNANDELVAAIQNRNLEKVTSLLEKGANPNIQFRDDSTPLFLTTLNGDLEMTGALLEKGADPNLYNKLGWTPLFIAAQINHVELARLLLDKGADVNANFGKGTALMVAAGNNSIAVTRFLISRGADVNAKTENGISPLSAASAGEHKEIIQLLRKHGAK